MFKNIVNGCAEQKEIPLDLYHDNVIQALVKNGYSLEEARRKVTENKEPNAADVGEALGLVNAESKRFQRQVVIDWRMPEDAQRIMLLERLSYLNTPNANTPIDERLFHDEKIKLLKQIKKLYTTKLPNYKKQVDEA